jgi:DNA mismatch repair ATPase MutS
MNLLVTLLLNGFYMRDLWLITRFNKWIENYSEQIPVWIEALSELDALVSLANYNSQNPGFVKPELSNDKFLSAKGLGHPLIDSLKRVNNNIELNSTGELFIVTGANMAGKSTFLRTVLINLVLASTGSRVCADYFVYKPSNIFSSIRTFDNLIDDVSYFQAELIRLKEMMSVAQNGEPVMVAIDEPLKGTNSEDKRRGSMLLLKKLIELPVCGMVATHDLELKVLADENKGFKLVCFELDFDKGKVIYDYKLKPGVASTMNATLLMKDMGLI